MQRERERETHTNEPATAMGERMSSLPRSSGFDLQVWTQIGAGEYKAGDEEYGILGWLARFVAAREEVLLAGLCERKILFRLEIYDRLRQATAKRTAAMALASGWTRSNGREIQQSREGNK